MNVRKFLKSFVHAFDGLIHVIRSQQNMRVHLVAAIGVIASGFFFQVNRFEWIAICVCISTVLAAECFNTAIERIADAVNPEPHPMIKHAKDASAAAVLVFAIGSIAVAMIIFVPRLYSQLFPAT